MQSYFTQIYTLRNHILSCLDIHEHQRTPKSTDVQPCPSWEPGSSLSVFKALHLNPPPKPKGCLRFICFEDVIIFNRRSSELQTGKEHMKGLASSSPVCLGPVLPLPNYPHWLPPLAPLQTKNITCYVFQTLLGALFPHIQASHLCKFAPALFWQYAN